jgi:hypothetical protein
MARQRAPPYRLRRDSAEQVPELRGGEDTLTKLSGPVSPLGAGSEGERRSWSAARARRVPSGPPQPWTKRRTRAGHAGAGGCQDALGGGPDTPPRRHAGYGPLPMAGVDAGRMAAPESRLDRTFHLVLRDPGGAGLIGRGPETLGEGTAGFGSQLAAGVDAGRMAARASSMPTAAACRSRTAHLLNVASPVPPYPENQRRSGHRPVPLSPRSSGVEAEIGWARGGSALLLTPLGWHLVRP